jgi:hypothetical protein
VAGDKLMMDSAPEVQAWLTSQIATYTKAQWKTPPTGEPSRGVKIAPIIDYNEMYAEILSQPDSPIPLSALQDGMRGELQEATFAEGQAGAFNQSEWPMVQALTGSVAPACTPPVNACTIGHSL